MNSSMLLNFSEPVIDTQKSRDECSLCAEFIDVYASGKCKHPSPVCHICLVRHTIICDKRSCPLCKEALDQVYFTNKDGGYDDFKDFIKGDNGFMYEDTNIEKKVKELFLHKCKQCLTKFDRFDQLELHIKKEHNKAFCNICILDLKVFDFERELFDEQEIKEHLSKKHVSCKYCDSYHADKDDLYGHTLDHHPQCGICTDDNDNELVFYRDYIELFAHFRTEHHVCEKCVESAPVNSAFRNKKELMAHMQRVHKNAKRQTFREKLDVKIRFNEPEKKFDYGTIVSVVASNHSFIQPHGAKTREDNVYFDKEAMGLARDDQELIDLIKLGDCVKYSAIWNPVVGHKSKWKATLVEKISEDEYNDYAKKVDKSGLRSGQSGACSSSSPNPLYSDKDFLAGTIEKVLEHHGFIMPQVFSLREDNVYFNIDVFQCDDIDEQITDLSKILEPGDCVKYVAKEQRGGFSSNWKAVTVEKITKLEYNKFVEKPGQSNEKEDVKVTEAIKIPTRKSNSRYETPQDNTQWRMVGPGGKSPSTSRLNSPKCNKKTAIKKGYVYNLDANHGFLTKEPFQTGYNENVYFNIQMYIDGVNNGNFISDLRNCIRNGSALYYEIDPTHKAKPRAKAVWRSPAVSTNSNERKSANDLRNTPPSIFKDDIVDPAVIFSKIEPAKRNVPNRVEMVVSGGEVGIEKQSKISFIASDKDDMLEDKSEFNNVHSNFTYYCNDKDADKTESNNNNFMQNCYENSSLASSADFSSLSEDIVTSEEQEIQSVPFLLKMMDKNIYESGDLPLEVVVNRIPFEDVKTRDDVISDIQDIPEIQITGPIMKQENIVNGVQSSISSESEIRDSISDKEAGLFFMMNGTTEWSTRCVDGTVEDDFKEEVASNLSVEDLFFNALDEMIGGNVVMVKAALFDERFHAEYLCHVDIYPIEREIYFRCYHDNRLTKQYQVKGTFQVKYEMLNKSNLLECIEPNTYQIKHTAHFIQVTRIVEKIQRISLFYRHNPQM